MKKKFTPNKTGNCLRRMTPSAIQRAAIADPDAQPLSISDLKRMKRMPQANTIRRTLDLTHVDGGA
jgi:putative transcriptional regulator